MRLAGRDKRMMNTPGGKGGASAGKGPGGHADLRRYGVGAVDASSERTSAASCEPRAS